MNSKNEHIQFTSEFENNDRFPFLDSMDFRENNIFHTTVYCNPGNSALN